MKNYTRKKVKNQELIFYIDKHVSDRTITRIGECNNFMEFIANKDLDKKKQIWGNSCKNRFCPICAWKLAKKDALKISICMKYIETEYKKSFIFLTLTAPNVKGNRLISEIIKFNKAFSNMCKRKDIDTINKGYIRKLEITYDNNEFITYDMWHGNLQKHIKPMFQYYQKLGLKINDKNPNYDTYHPHFHIVMAVNKSYFTDKTYIKQETWLNIWRNLMDDQSITQVDVRRVNKHKENKEIKEISKYAAKDSDMMISQNVFDTFYKALKGRQVITYNGIFKEANKLYKNGELNKYKTLDNIEYVYLLFYQWGKNEYIQTELRELTELERQEINKNLINELEISE